MLVLVIEFQKPNCFSSEFEQRKQVVEYLLHYIYLICIAFFLESYRG